VVTVLSAMPCGSWLKLVASENTEQVWVLEAAPKEKFALVAKIPVGKLPHQMAVSPDGKYVAVGAIEMRFWADLVKVLGLAADDLPVHVDKSEWPRLRKVLTEAIGKYTRDELVARAEGTDACLTPVLSPWEAAQHPHNAARGTFVDIGGVVQPAPAPRFGRTPPETPEPPHEKGADTAEVLSEYGLDGPEIERLKEAGVVS